MVALFTLHKTGGSCRKSKPNQKRNHLAFIKLPEFVIHGTSTCKTAQPPLCLHTSPSFTFRALKAIIGLWNSTQREYNLPKKSQCGAATKQGIKKQTSISYLFSSTTCRRGKCTSEQCKVNEALFLTLKLTGKKMWLGVNYSEVCRSNLQSQREQVQERRDVAAPWFCIPLAVEHNAAHSGHLNPGHSAAGSHKGLIPSRGSCGMQEMSRTLMSCKIFCLFICTVERRPHFSQIPKAKPPLPLTLWTLSQEHIICRDWFQEPINQNLHDLCFPLEKQSWNNGK